MDDIPVELITIILDLSMQTGTIPYDDNLLVLSSNKDWEKSVTNTPTALCSVCKEWNEVITNHLVIPYQRVRMLVPTGNIITRYKKIKCINPVLKCLPQEGSSPQVEFVIYQPGVIVGKMKIIGFRTYNDVITKFKAEDKKKIKIARSFSTIPIWHRKYLPNNENSLRILHYLCNRNDARGLCHSIFLRVHEIIGTSDRHSLQIELGTTNPNLLFSEIQWN